MLLHINGEAQEVNHAVSITQLLSFFNLEKKKIAVSVNRQIVPTTSYSTWILKEHDTIEIIHAVGGG